MELSTIISLVTIVVTFILGIISKKSTFVKNELIPLQNLIGGIIGSVIYYAITKDINLVIASMGWFTGGTYDFIKNIKDLLNISENTEIQG